MTLSQVRCTLLTDGPTDNVLLNHIDWAIKQHTKVAIQSTWADLSRLPNRPKGLGPRIQTALDLYPCDMLCIHRDAEKEEFTIRTREIRVAISSLQVSSIPAVCVVPVRMQEAWLLFDENAIRRAAGNPRGQVDLQLPRLSRMEAVADPKEVLYDLLRKASELRGRRLKTFSHSQAARLVGENISDFSPLRILPAFAAFEDEVTHALKTLNP